jgi:hypothetical protein
MTLNRLPPPALLLHYAIVAQGSTVGRREAPRQARLARAWVGRKPQLHHTQLSPEYRGRALLQQQIRDQWVCDCVPDMTVWVTQQTAKGEL